MQHNVSVPSASSSRLLHVTGSSQHCAINTSFHSGLHAMSYCTLGLNAFSFVSPNSSSLSTDQLKHAQVRQTLLRAQCVLSLSLSCLLSLATASAMTPPSKSAPSFASASAKTLPSTMNLCLGVIFSAVFLVVCALICTLSQQISTLSRLCMHFYVFPAHQRPCAAFCTSLYGLHQSQIVSVHQRKPSFLLHSNYTGPTYLLFRFCPTRPPCASQLPYIPCHGSLVASASN